MRLSSHGSDGKHAGRRSCSPGRPSCAILPAAAKTDLITISFGCKGNRTFTTVGDDELYIAVPGGRWDEFVERLIEVQRSNLTMGNYYQAQAAKFAAAK